MTLFGTRTLILWFATCLSTVALLDEYVTSRCLWRRWCGQFVSLAWNSFCGRSPRTCQRIRAQELRRRRLGVACGHKRLKRDLDHIKPPWLFFVQDPPPHLVPWFRRVEGGVPIMTQRFGVILQALVQDAWGVLCAGSTSAWYITPHASGHLLT